MLLCMYGIDGIHSGMLSSTDCMWCITDGFTMGMHAPPRIIIPIYRADTHHLPVAKFISS